MLTELFDARLAPNSDINDPNNAAGKMIRECSEHFKTHNIKDFYYGLHVEDPEMLAIVVQWDNIEHFEKTTGSEEFKKLSHGWHDAMAGPPQLHLVDFEPQDAVIQAASANVTEVVRFAFNGGPPADAQENVKKAVEEIDPHRRSCPGAAYGSTLQEVEKDDLKGKAGALIVGWDSIEKHLEVRASQAYKENAHLVRNGGALIETHHVEFIKA